MIREATGDKSQRPQPLSEKTFIPLHFHLGEIPEHLVVMQETHKCKRGELPKATRFTAVRPSLPAEDQGSHSLLTPRGPRALPWAQRSLLQPQAPAAPSQPALAGAVLLHVQVTSPSADQVASARHSSHIPVGVGTHTRQACTKAGRAQARTGPDAEDGGVRPVCLPQTPGRASGTLVGGAGRSPGLHFTLSQISGPSPKPAFSTRSLCCGVPPIPHGMGTTVLEGKQRRGDPHPHVHSPLWRGTRSPSPRLS